MKMKKANWSCKYCQNEKSEIDISTVKIPGFVLFEHTRQLILHLGVLAYTFQIELNTKEDVIMNLKSQAVKHVLWS